MYKLTRKNLYFVWMVACLVVVSMMVAMTINLWLLIVTFFFLIWYAVISKRMLHCPNCKHMENLMNLTYAINHTYYCRNCGQKITIQKI